MRQPTCSATICDSVVRVPWPWLVAPVATATFAARQHPHRDALERAQARALDVIAEPDADEAAFVERRALPLAEAFIVGLRQRGLLPFRIIAAVVDQRLAVAEQQADFVRHLLRLDEIAPPHLGAIELQFARDAVEQTLHGEHRLRPAGAAHRRRRHLVGEHHHGVELIGRNHIRTRHGRRGDVRHDDAPRHEGAGIVQHAAAHAENFCVRVDRDGDAPILIALLGGAQKMLAPVLDPFHRPAQLQRRRRDHGFLRIEDRLRPKAAADIGRDHADRFQFAAEQVGEHAAADMRRLRARPHRQQIGCGVVAGEHRARLDRHAAAAVLPELILEDMRGVGEGGIDVAVSKLERRQHIGAERGVGPRRAVLDRVAAVADRRQRVVMHGDRGGGILGNVARVGDHHRDRLADIIDFGARQRVLGAQRRDRRIGQQHRHRFAAHRIRQILGGDDGVDAGYRQRRLGVDAVHARVRIRRADEAGVQHAGHFHVVDETAAAGQQRRIFEPRHARAEMFCAHGVSPPPRCANAAPRRAPL